MTDVGPITYIMEQLPSICLPYSPYGLKLIAMWLRHVLTACSQRL